MAALAPILKTKLNLSTRQSSHVVSALQIVDSFSQPIAGFLRDLVGPRFGYAVVWGGVEVQLLIGA
ncbi:MAG: hypothetical protein KGM15_01375 [Pseudomonadota bacterium]|nr:hypothetical protein [Pseudomonadota bacterium]